MHHRSPQPTGWGDLLLRWTLHLVAANRTAQTIETRTEHLRRIARAFPNPDAFTAADWEQWSGSHQWATETRRSYSASIRGFFRWYNGTDPTAELPPIKPSHPAPRPIPDTLLLPALEVADARTRRILRLAAEAGLRRAEIAGLPRTALDHDAELPRLTVTGKGRRTRTIPISSSLAAELAACPEPWIFPGPAGHLTPRHVGALASRVLPAPWTLHSLRHRFAAAAYADHDLLAVQDLLGHASPSTTRRYIPTSIADMWTAAKHAQIYL